MIKIILYCYCIIIVISHIHAQIFQPISQYTDTFQYNGQQQSRNVLTIHCSESSRYGQLVAGSITVNISCIPPKFLYDYVEVGRIPRYQELHAEQVCLVDNMDQYSKSQASLSSTQNSINQIQGSMRRLLGLFGFEGTDWMGAIPIYGGLLTANNARKAFENTLDLESKTNLMDQRLKNSENMLNNLNEWQSTTTSVVDEINQASAITAQQIAILVQDTKTNLQYNQAQDHLFNQLSEYTNQTTKALSDNINQVYTSLSQQQDATVIANNKTFNNILGLISNLSSIVDNNFKYFNNFINLNLRIIPTFKIDTKLAIK